MEAINSRQNPLVRTFRDAAQGRRTAGERRRGAGAGYPLLLEGNHLVAEALDAGVRVEVAAVASESLDERHKGGRRKEIGGLADRLTRAGARVVAVSSRVMAAMSPAETPSGLVAIARHEPITPDSAFDAGRTGRPLVLVVDAVQDPGNLGAMIRTAEAAGASAVVVCEGSADPFGWKALRGAMGSSLRLPVAGRLPAIEAIAAARARGLRIVATDPRSASTLYDSDLTRPTAVLMGGEGAGLGPDILKLADQAVSIPMQPPVESLNVAVACGLVLYEAFRQRQGLGTRG